MYMKKIECAGLHEANPLALVPKTHRVGIPLLHFPPTLGAGAGFGPGDHPTAPAARAAAQDVSIAPEGTGVRFPHHHIHHFLAVEADHGSGDDEKPHVLTPGDLGLIAAVLAAEFKKPAQGLNLSEKVSVMLSAFDKVFVILEMFPDIAMLGHPRSGAVGLVWWQDIFPAPLHTNPLNARTSCCGGFWLRVRV